MCNSFFFSKTSFLYKIEKTIYRGCINPRFVLNADYLILVCDRMKVKSLSWSFVSLISRSCFVWTLWCWVILLRYTLLWRTRSRPTFDPCVKWSVTRGYRVGLARVYPLLLFYYYNKFPLQYLKTNVLFFYWLRIYLGYDFIIDLYEYCINNAHVPKCCKFKSKCIIQTIASK